MASTALLIVNMLAILKCSIIEYTSISLRLSPQKHDPECLDRYNLEF